jgi:hypothetical protein
MQPPNPSWYEHVDLMQVILTASIGYFVYSWRQGMQDFRTNIKDLYEKYNDLNAGLNELRGEHKSNHKGA